VSRPVVQNGVMIVVMLFLSGCFSYIPMELGAVPQGQEVRVYLTREGQIDLAEFPNHEGPLLRGRLLGSSNDQLYLRVPIAVRREGFHTATLNQDIWIPAHHIVQIESRELSRAGTGLLVAGAAGVAAAVVLVIMTGARPGVEPPEDGPPEMRAPLATIPVRIPLYSVPTRKRN